MKRIFWAGAVIFLMGCGTSKVATEAATSVDNAEQKSAVLSADAVSVQDAPQVDLSALPETAVTVYTQGTAAFTLGDILPLMSDSGGYTQKWEFYIYTRPYEVRLKFEISNFAFSRNEGKVRGYVKRYEGDVEAETFEISQNYKKGAWSASSDQLDLVFGDYALKFADGQFHVSGTFERGNFAYEIPVKGWKPGSGNVYFGNSADKVFKYGVLTYHEPVTKGVVTVDGQPVDVNGRAYGNHYATTLNVYDMFDEVADFRKLSDDLLVEFRYYVPSAKYEAKPFGFMFVAFEGVPVLSATTLARTTLETWLDDAHYGYEIDMRQEIVGHDGENQARFRMLTGVPEAIDYYADLPAFQRNIASRFAKPIEYRIDMDWELDLSVDGYEAKIPAHGLYTVTRLR